MLPPQFFAVLDKLSFPRVTDPDAEARKLAFLRILTGLVLIWRTALIARDSLYFFEPTSLTGPSAQPAALAGISQLLLALGFTLGVMPATCALLLAVSHPIFSVWTGTHNLAVLLLIPLLGAFAVLDTGHLSLGGRNRPPLPATCYRNVYLVLFTVYAALNFQAVLYHVNDSHWVEGRTTAVLFTNSYLSVFYEFFREIESASPLGFWVVSAVAGVAQTVFQVAMVPLFLSRWGAPFVKWWGWIFIVGSVIDLRISVLPVVEVVYWLAIFHPLSAAPLAADFASKAGLGRRFRQYLVHAFTGSYALLLVLFFTNAIAGYANRHPLPPWVGYPLLFYAGLDAPNVFNRDDLSMGDRWAVIERMDGPDAVPIPFTGAEGERLGYHRGDLLYFGNSLRWRRGMIDVSDLVAYHQPGAPGHAYAMQIARYDHRQRHSARVDTYRVTLYRNRASRHEEGTGRARYEPVRLFDFTLTVGGP